jgi:hypothetical protein
MDRPVSELQTDYAGLTLNAELLDLVSNPGIVPSNSDELYDNICEIFII